MAKKLKPIHPGEQLREEFMVPLGLSSNALARAIDVTRHASMRSCASGVVSLRIRHFGWPGILESRMSFG